MLLMETDGANSRRLSALSDEAILAEVMRELRASFPDAPWPSGYIIHRLGENPFQRGEGERERREGLEGREEGTRIVP